MEKKVGFGTVGYGMIATTHLLGMQANRMLHPGAPAPWPRALCTQRPEACAGLPYEKIYTTVEELLADGEVAVVDICTPNHLHAPAALAVLAAGKALYVEKPLSHRLDEAGRMQRAAQAAGLPNQTALTVRFRPTVNRMKDLLDAGTIGVPIHFRCCFYHGSYLDEKRPTSWRQQFARCGGGAVMDLGIHILDMVRYLLGEVETVCATARTVNKRRPAKAGEPATVENDTDEYLCAMLHMKSGAAGVMESSRVSTSALGNEVFEIFGTKGSLTLDFDGPGALWHTPADGSGSVRTTGAAPGPYEKAVSALLPPARQSLGPFVDAHAAAILNICRWHAGEKPFAGTPTFVEGVRAQALVDACLRSAESGGWEKPALV